MPSKPGAKKTVLKNQSLSPSINSIEEFKVSILPKGNSVFDNPMEYYQPLIDHIPYFAPGRYMWYVVEKLTILKIGGMVGGFTGKTEWEDWSPEEYFQYIHLEDMSFVMTYAKLVHDFLLQIPADKKNNYHPNLYFRLKNVDSGEYRLILFQYVDWLYNNDGEVESILHVLYDISHIGLDNFKPMLTILDEENETLYFSKANIHVLEDKLSSVEVVHLTKREKDIIRLLAKGLSSKQMALQLEIAKNTIENHRQNILKKTGCTTSAEIVSYAMKYGFL